MKVLVQRVLGASVAVSGETVGEIDNGLLLFAGFARGDSVAVVKELASKSVNLRIFEDQSRRLQYSLLDVAGSVLAVPQFTLYASSYRGRRPDFSEALEPGVASELFDRFVDTLDGLTGTSVARGVFGADMRVSLVNDGPFTIMLQRESDRKDSSSGSR